METSRTTERKQKVWRERVTSCPSTVNPVPSGRSELSSPYTTGTCTVSVGASF